MNQKDPDYTHKDNPCEPTGCCSTPSHGKSCCGWKGVIFVIVLLLTGVVVAHSLWTDQNGTIDEGLTSGSIGTSGGEPVGSGYAEQEQQQAISASETEQTATVHVIPGTQEVCPVMGNPIKEDVFADYDGKRVYFCCPGCDGKFMEEPEKYIAQMETEGVVLAQVVTNGNGEAAMEGCGGDCEGMGEQAAPQQEAPAGQVIAGTQTVCPVMPSHPIKESVFVDYQGKRIYLCCAGCISKINAEPEKYLAPMEAEGVVFAQVVTNGNGEAAMENCGKCETILEKLTRIEQLLEQLLSSKTEGQVPDATAPKAANVIK